MSIRWRRALPTFTLLTALLVTPTLAQARPSRPDSQGRPAVTESAGFLGSLWHLLTSFWGAEGASIDPWGGHAQPTNGARSSGGLHSLWGASGGSIDPWGGQVVPHSGNQGATGDSGGSIDPNG